MTRVLCTLLFLGLFSGFAVQAQSDSIGCLEIEFAGIDSEEGQISIGINYGPKGFPRKPDEEIQFSKEGLKDGKLTVRVKDLPYGTYAISALDDLDFDVKMKMFLGLPKEAFGFSGNPEVRLRAPHYEDCSFVFNQPNQKIEILIRHYRQKK